MWTPHAGPCAGFIAASGKRAPISRIFHSGIAASAMSCREVRSASDLRRNHLPRWDIQPNLVVLIQSIGRPVDLRPAPMRRVLFVALALLCLASCATRAQSCEAFSDTSSACSAHLPPGALVHVPASLTLQNLTDATDVALASALSLPPPCGFFPWEPHGDMEAERDHSAYVVTEARSPSSRRR